MSKKSVVLSALAAALSMGAAEASAIPDVSGQEVVPHAPQSPLISVEARDLLLQSASKVGEQESTRPFRIAQGKFKLFEDGPSFVESKPTPR
jgi:hypothetical protein